MGVIAVIGESGARIHHVGQQDPAVGTQHFVHGQLGGIRLVDRFEQLRVFAELLRPVVIGHHARRGRRDLEAAAIGDRLFVAGDLAGVMIEPESDARLVGEVGEDVIAPDGDLAVLDVFGVNEFDRIDLFDFLKQDPRRRARRNRSV